MDDVIGCALNYHAECVQRLEKDQKKLSDAVALLVVSLKLSFLPFLNFHMKGFSIPKTDSWFLHFYQDP